MMEHTFWTLLWKKLIFACVKNYFDLSNLGKEIEFEEEKESDSVLLENNSGTGKMTISNMNDII